MAYRTCEYVLEVQAAETGEEIYTPEELTMLINDGLDLRTGVQVRRTEKDESK